MSCIASSIRSGTEGDLSAGWGAVAEERDMGESAMVYQRALPGGGYVAIYAAPTRSLLGVRRVEGSLVVERREPPRREGHEPPVVARATGHSLASVLDDLFPLAQSNTAVAARCLRPRDGAPLRPR